MNYGRASCRKYFSLILIEGNIINIGRFYRILCEAAQHDYEEISFAGFVALFKFSEDKQIVAKMTKKQVVMAIDAVIKGIAKFPESA
jgi:hypothetical protein